MICKKCGEELGFYDDWRLGICDDCYIYYDMDRFKEIEDEQGEYRTLNQDFPKPLP